MLCFAVSLDDTAYLPRYRIGGTERKGSGIWVEEIQQNMDREIEGSTLEVHFSLDMLSRICSDCIHLSLACCNIYFKAASKRGLAFQLQREALEVVIKF